MSGHHISTDRFLWGVAIALFILTFLTVAVTWFHIPEPWNVAVAIGIAVVKALIVMAFFMNLYWDTRFNILVIIMGFAFFSLMIGMTLLDTLFRVDPVPAF